MSDNVLNCSVNAKVAFQSTHLLVMSVMKLDYSGFLLLMQGSFFSNVDVTSSSLQLCHHHTNFICRERHQEIMIFFLFLGGALNNCTVCPLCTWVAQLGSIPVLWGGYTLVPWSLPHLLPYAPVQVTRQDELHQLATDRENSNLLWLPDIVLLQQLEVLRFLIHTSHVFLLDELVLVWGASVTRFD